MSSNPKKIITLQELINAHVDAKDLELILNEAEWVEITTRLGRKVYAISTINAIIEQYKLLADSEIQNLKYAISVALAAGAGEAGWTDSLVRTWSGLTQNDNNKRRKYLEDFGGIGDGKTVNDEAFKKAIFNMSDGETLWLQDRANYFFNNIDTIKKSINIKCEGQATITQDNPAATGILYESKLVARTMLSQTQYINSRHWRVESTQGIKKGSLFVVKSNLSWYFDPRPDSTDARKSELHRVLFVDHNSKTVVTECEANDGYADSEYVEVRIYDPISAFVKNIEVINKQRGVRQGAGIRFKHGYNCKILNNIVIDYGNTPSGLEECYASHIISNSISGCVESSTYATKITGCTLSFATNNIYNGNYAAVDISGFNIISLMCGAVGNTVFAGGVNSAGETLGYKDGVRGVVTRGVGSHAASDKCVFLNNKLYDCVNGGIVIRGRNHLIDGNNFAGRYANSVIHLYDGMSAQIKNNSYVGSYYGGKESLTQPGVGNLHYHYPESFVTIFNNWHSDGRNPTIIKGNNSISHNSFLEIAGDGLKYCKDVVIEDNDIVFATPTTTGMAYLINKRSTVSNVVEVGRGFSVGKNTVKMFFSNSKFRIFSKEIIVKRGVFIETAGSEEELEVGVKGVVNWTNPALTNFRLSFKGFDAVLDFSVSGGAVSAVDQALYSCDFRVPYLGNQVSNTAIMGACSSFDAKGLISLGTTGEIRLTAKRDSISNVPQIRGYAKYPIGL